ncbi:MAG TPA: TolC family protein, partial [Planctomycetota bacterium]|nr:TolC family protein [Planctomycetota bacterium]
LNIQQPLLKNFGWEVNHASIDIAGLQVHQADARLKLATIQLLANTEKTYWDYVAAYEQVKIQVDKYKLAQQQVETAKKMVEEGVRTKVEI